jgi:hypothetical protein
MAETKVRKLFGIGRMIEVFTVVQFISMTYGERLNSVAAFGFGPI